MTYDGKISSSTFDSLYAANQAKSIALTGMTMEMVEEYELERDRKRAEWDAAHPYREPAADWERKFVSGKWISTAANALGTWSARDGLIKENYPGDFTDSVGSGNSIRSAVVFKDAGDDGRLDN